MPSPSQHNAIKNTYTQTFCGRTKKSSTQTPAASRLEPAESSALPIRSATGLATDADINIATNITRLDADCADVLL